jgi:hypothetical protein
LPRGAGQPHGIGGDRDRLNESSQGRQGRGLRGQGPRLGETGSPADVFGDPQRLLGVTRRWTRARGEHPRQAVRDRCIPVEPLRARAQNADGARAVPGLRQRTGQTLVRTRIARAQSQGGPQVHDGLVVPTQVRQVGAQPEVGVEVVRTHVDGAPEVPDGPVELAPTMLQQAEVVERVGEIRLELDRRPQRRRGRLDVAPGQKRRAQLGMGFGELRVDADRFLEELDRRIVSAASGELDAAVQGFDGTRAQLLKLGRQRILERRLIVAMPFGQHQLSLRVVEPPQLAERLSQCVVGRAVFRGKLNRFPEVDDGSARVAAAQCHLPGPTVRLRCTRRQLDHPLVPGARRLEPVAPAVGVGATQQCGHVLRAHRPNPLQLVGRALPVTTAGQHEPQVVPPANLVRCKYRCASIARLGQGKESVGMVEHAQLPVGGGIPGSFAQTLEDLAELHPDRRLHRPDRELRQRRQIGRGRFRSLPHGAQAAETPRQVDEDEHDHGRSRR